jgi:uncharacterized damage-inducible protein DinB
VKKGEAMIDEIRETLELMQSRVLEALGEIPDDRLHWKPTPASTSPAEIVWHMANTERRLATIVRGDDPNAIGAEAGTRAWIEAAGTGAADTSDVPRDRAGLEAALAGARQQTLAALASVSPEQLAEPTVSFAGQPRTRAFWARFIGVHHSYHAGQLFTLGALVRGGL